MVPDPESLKRLAQEKSLKGIYSELCTMSVVKKAIIDDMTSLGKKAGLKSFEQVSIVCNFVSGNGS